MKRVTFPVSGFAILLLTVWGCGQSEPQLSKNEEKNFKGSSEMSEEAKKRMAEGMKKMAEMQKMNGQPAPAAPSSGG
ncbi:MAG: hypothetical protein H7Y17_08080 [Chlorobia bacterium]|nr:hypothetical protein [Fimbriimonadaceae bacterium]